MPVKKRNFEKIGKKKILGDRKKQLFILKPRPCFFLKIIVLFFGRPKKKGFFGHRKKKPWVSHWEKKNFFMTFFLPCSKKGKKKKKRSEKNFPPKAILVFQGPKTKIQKIFS